MQTENKMQSRKYWS